MTVEVFSEGIAPVIAEICRQIGLVDTIDRMTEWDRDRCKLSPGQRVTAIIINALMDRYPLLHLPSFFSDMDVQKMFGREILPEDLNDHTMGRALDKLAEADPEQVYTQAALRATVEEDVELGIIHADTTSVSVQGAYEGENDQLNLARGYSKDRRPDLKQFLLGLGVTPDSIPVIAQVRDGNTADVSWNGDIIDLLRNRLELDEQDPLIYVADSKLVSKTNLDRLAEENLLFISRLPANFKLDEQLKARAWQRNDWQEIGATSKSKDAAQYRCQSFEDDLCGRTYRFIVVHSSKLDGRKERGINNRLDKREKQLGKDLDDLCKRDFACEADAWEVWEDFCAKSGHPCFHLDADVESFERRIPRDKPGRPPRDYKPELETRYRIVPALNRDEDAIRKRKSRASCFVLITNIQDQKEWSDRRILIEYKDQSTVEQHFRFIKKPKVTGPMYLKNPGRVNALGYVFLMALMIYSVMQRRVRNALKNEDQPMQIIGTKGTFRPTGNRVLEQFKKMKITRDEQGKREFPRNLRIPRRVMCLLGVKPEVYLRDPPG